MQAMLAIGSAMLGAAHVMGMDCDADALATAADNIDAFDGLEVCANDWWIGGIKHPGVRFEEEGCCLHARHVLVTCYHPGCRQNCLQLMARNVTEIWTGIAFMRSSM